MNLTPYRDALAASGGMTVTAIDDETLRAIVEECRAEHPRASTADVRQQVARIAGQVAAELELGAGPASVAGPATKRRFPRSRMG